MPSRRHLVLGAALGTVYLVWGSTYLAIVVAIRTLPPLLMLSVRFLLAGAILYAFSAWRGDVSRARPGRREWGAAALVGGLLLVVDTGCVAWAEQRVASGLTALLVASVPLYMALLDRAFFGVRITLGAAAGIAAGLLGVGLLVGPSTRIDALGAIVILFGTFAWAAGSAYARVAPLPRASFLSASMQMLSAGVLLAVASAATGEMAQVRLDAISPQSLGALAYLVVFGSIIAFSAYAWLLRTVSGQLASTYAYVNPAVAVLLGWALVGEHVSGRELASGAVIVASVGLLVLSRPDRRRTEPLEPAPASPKLEAMPADEAPTLVLPALALVPVSPELDAIGADEAPTLVLPAPAPVPVLTRLRRTLAW